MNRKNIFKLITYALFLFSCFIMPACEGTPVYEQTMKDNNGVWECQYILYSKTECAVGGWTDEYNLQHDYLSYVFLPSHINGVKVVEVGYHLGLLGEEKVYHGHARGDKIFLPYTIKMLRITNDNNYMIPNQQVQGLASGQNYVPKIYFNDYRAQFPVSLIECANVVYDINYLNEEYKYHSVDYYEYGNLIEIIPPNPERIGYTFSGWYKEPECITKWNFETDTLPELILDDEGNKVFQETALYAKWI